MTSDSKRGRPPTPAGPKRPATHKRQGLGDLLALDSDRSSRLLLIGSVVAILLLAFGFIAFGYWDTVIKPRHRTVLGADGINISYTAMKRRMAYDIQQDPKYLQSQQAVNVLPSTAYAELLNEIILVKRGPSDQGVQVSDDELQQALNTKIGVANDADKQAFAAAFRGALDRSHLQEDEYRRIVLANTIQSKLQTKFQSELPATVPQAKLDVIQLNAQADADAALARVKAGEDWSTVAKAVSTESDKDTTGGTHDYAPEGDVAPAYSGFAFSAPVGQISDVITSGTGDTATYYVVRVTDRADKPLTPAQIPAAAQRRYAQWIDDMQAQMTITNGWDQTSQQNALISVLRSTPPPTAVPTSAAPITSQDTPSVSGTPVAEPTSAGANGQPTAGSNNPVAPSAPVAPGGGNVP